jgi:hypothetical protein
LSKAVVSLLGLVLAATIGLSAPGAATGPATPAASISTTPVSPGRSGLVQSGGWLDGRDQGSSDTGLERRTDPNSWLRQMDPGTASSQTLQDLVNNPAYQADPVYRDQVNRLIELTNHMNRVDARNNPYGYGYGYGDYYDY